MRARAEQDVSPWAEPAVITDADLVAAGDVNQALEHLYTGALAASWTIQASKKLPA